MDTEHRVVWCGVQGEPGREMMKKGGNECLPWAFGGGGSGCVVRVCACACVRAVSGLDWSDWLLLLETTLLSLCSSLC